MRPDTASEPRAAQPAHGPPLNNSRLAREMRHALDELGALVEDGNEHVCTVEDAFGLEYPAVENRPTEAVRAEAWAEMPEALEAIAKVENCLRRQVWTLARARRDLARMLREEAHG